jgi:hypothetical protein
LSKPFVDYEQLDAAEHWLPTVWPFGGRATTVD